MPIGISNNALQESDASRPLGIMTERLAI